MKVALLALALVGGCTVEREALHSAPDAPVAVSTCDAAWLAPDGATCSLSDACFRASGSDPLCCQDIVFCGAGSVVHETKCDPSCSKCSVNGECAFGKAICDLGRCVACPDLGACAPCPAGLAPLARNGCLSCDCAPPSQCDAQQRPCGGVQKCYLGEICVKGCVPAYDCCANVCADVAPPCSMPAPLGCNMKCPVELGCGICAATSCICDQGNWICKPQCSEISTSCFLP